MKKRRKEKPFLEDVAITGVAAEGKAIGKVNNVPVFVPYAIPGDVVDVQVTRKKSNYMEGTVATFKQHSPNSQTPFCSHFGVCGGCKWQRLPYALQLQYKQQQVIDQLTRIGKLQLPEVSPIIGSEKTTYYRNKLEYTFSNKRWITKEEVLANTPIEFPQALGFHIPEMFDKVLNIDHCYLQPAPSDNIRIAIRQFALDNSYDFFDIRLQSGYLRNLIIRTTSQGEVMVIVVFYYEDTDKHEALLSFIRQQFPRISSLLYIINPKANDTINDLPVHTYYGKDYIEEQMEGLRFKIGPKSFYQTNSEQAYRLYQITRNFAALTGNEIVYDLYTGTGTIANFVAKQAKKVVGVEYVPEAIADAEVNAQANGISNTVFYAGDMKDILNAAFIQENGQPDVIILDPPRSGIHPDVAKVILAALPPRIVYVSCNPATQARDIALLAEHYKVEKVQPVDMFPHTHHVENVVLLQRID